MSAKLQFSRDVQGYNSFAANVAGDKYSATLLAAGNSTLTLPTNVTSWIVNFSYQPGATVWVGYNANAAAPAGNTFASIGSELLPGSRVMSSTKADGTAATINLLNSGTDPAHIGIVLYAYS